MSDVEEAERIKSRDDFKQFTSSYEKIISKFPAFVSIQPPGTKMMSFIRHNDYKSFRQGLSDVVIEEDAQEMWRLIRKELLESLSFKEWVSDF